MTKMIAVSYAVYEPDHEGDPSDTGWSNDGEEFATLLEAAVWLQDEGAVHASSSEPVPHMWFTSEVIQDPHTGQETESSYHPSGFTEREMATLFLVVRDMPKLGHPDRLEYCWADEWLEFAKDLTIEDGVITASPDPSLVGMHTAAAYIERFAVDRQEEVEWQDGPDGTDCLVLPTNDAVFFASLDRPVVARRISDNGVSYSMEKRSFISAVEVKPIT